MMADFRVLLFNQDGTPEGELSKDAGTLLSCTRSEEINAEHSLNITTDRHLDVGTRALTYHKDGRWREWVVDEPSETHESGEHAECSYHMCWSLQYDLQTTYGHIQAIGVDPGTDYGAPGFMDSVYDVSWTTSRDARTALGCALTGSAMWVVGKCDVTTKVRYVVMDAESSAWDRLTTIVKYWGGEIDAEIQVDANGVTSRRVCLYQHLGSKVANRRFEWGHDLTGITRTPDPGPYYCHVIPLGDGESEDLGNDTTFDVPIDVSGTKSYTDASRGVAHDRGNVRVRDLKSEEAFRKRTTSGGWEYPTCVVKYPTDDPDELLDLALDDVLNHTRPGISYSGSVANFAKTGMDTDGIVLGDEVQVIDNGFHRDVGLRVQERILSMEIDELGIDDAQINIGRLVPKLEKTIAAVAETLGASNVAYQAPVWDGSKWLKEIYNLSHQLVDEAIADLDYDPKDYEIDIPDYGAAIADLQTSVGDISTALGLDGDGIIHTLDGVEIGPGSVVAFTSTGESEEIDHGKGEDILPNEWGKSGIFPKNKSGKAVVGRLFNWGSGS